MQGIVAEATRTCRTILTCIWITVFFSVLLSRHIDLSTLRDARLHYLQGQVHELFQKTVTDCKSSPLLDVLETGNLLCQEGKPASQPFLGPHQFHGIRISESGSVWKKYPIQSVPAVQNLRFLAGSDLMGNKWLGVEQSLNGTVIFAANREDLDLINSEWIWITLLMLLVFVPALWVKREKRLNHDFLIPLRSSLLWIHEGRLNPSPCREIEDLRTELLTLRYQLQTKLGSLASQWAETAFEPHTPSIIQPDNLLSLKQNLVNALRIVMYPCFAILYACTGKLLTNPHVIPLPHTMLLITTCVLLPVVTMRFLKKKSQTELEIEVLNLYLKSVSEGKDPIQSYLTLRQKLGFQETTHILNLWHQEMLQRQKSIESAGMLLQLKALCSQKQTDPDEIKRIANLTLMSTCNVGYLGWDKKLNEPILSGQALATKPELMDQILTLLYQINQSTGLPVQPQQSVPPQVL